MNAKDLPLLSRQERDSWGMIPVTYSLRRVIQVTAGEMVRFRTTRNQALGRKSRSGGIEEWLGNVAWVCMGMLALTPLQLQMTKRSSL